MSKIDKLEFRDNVDPRTILFRKINEIIDVINGVVDEPAHMERRDSISGARFKKGDVVLYKGSRFHITGFYYDAGWLYQVNFLSGMAGDKGVVGIPVCNDSDMSLDSHRVKQNVDDYKLRFADLFKEMESDLGRCGSMEMYHGQEIKDYCDRPLKENIIVNFNF